ncbi:hypothetical protein PMAYCL1PPCAC_32751, partial [Pristionchus mayeri]
PNFTTWKMYIRMNGRTDKNNLIIQVNTFGESRTTRPGSAPVQLQPTPPLRRRVVPRLVPYLAFFGICGRSVVSNTQLRQRNLTQVFELDNLVVVDGRLLVDGRGIRQPGRLVPADRHLCDDDGILQRSHR